MLLEQRLVGGVEEFVLKNLLLLSHNFKNEHKSV